MKRYLVFAGSRYYPAGGWGDFISDFDSMQEAMAFIEPKYSPDYESEYDWYHIVDSYTGKIETSNGGF